jgi:hypothetical protein
VSCDKISVVLFSMTMLLLQVLVAIFGVSSLASGQSISNNIYPEVHPSFDKSNFNEQSGHDVLRELGVDLSNEGKT